MSVFISGALSANGDFSLMKNKFGIDYLNEDKIAGKDTNGNILVIHCSSSNNNVVITTNSGFGFVARTSAY